MIGAVGARVGAGRAIDTEAAIDDKELMMDVLQICYIFYQVVKTIHIVLTYHTKQIDQECCLTEHTRFHQDVLTLYLVPLTTLSPWFYVCK